MKRNNRREVGLFEAAKTHLSSLIERVGHGEEIIITNRGTAVARLVAADGRERRDPTEAAARIRELRRGINLGSVRIRGPIEEGRL
jgi:prevent-host-death family protein